MKKTKFIAEVSSNHSNNLNRCYKIIDVCKKSGFYAVKFQLFKINKLFSKEILKKSLSHRKRKKRELDRKLIPKLASYCKKKKIKFGCTPFDIDSAAYLNQYVDFYKISSYDTLNIELIKSVLNKNKTLIISTGMINLKELYPLLKILNKKKTIFLRCVSEYPAKIKNANLRSIETLSKILKKKQFNPSVGWSDHTKSKAVIYRAVHKYNASYIELHVDLDGNGYEFSSGHCWVPREFKNLIKDINVGYESDGNGKIHPCKNELQERNWRADPHDGLRPLKIIRSKI